MRRVARMVRADTGTTLVELLLGIGVTVIAGAVMLTSLLSVQRVEGYATDQAEALRTLQHASERLTRELRQARRVYPESTPRAIVFWLDRDRDNVQDPDERITWEVVTVDGVTRLQRTTDAAAEPHRVEVGISGQDVFTYLPSVAAATRVAISLEADVRPDPRDEAARHVETEVTLRNVAE